MLAIISKIFFAYLIVLFVVTVIGNQIERRQDD